MLKLITLGELLLIRIIQDTRQLISISKIDLDVHLSCFYALSIHLIRLFMQELVCLKLKTIILSRILVIYAPALAIREVCKVNMDAAILTMGLVCCVYTSLGGIKAVIWTDVVQYLAMYAGFMVIIGKGLLDMGLDHIIETAKENDRNGFKKS